MPYMLNMASKFSTAAIDFEHLEMRRTSCLTKLKDTVGRFTCSC